MAYIFSNIPLSSTDRGFISNVGQSVVYDAVAEYVTRVNADMNAAMSVFVETTTEGFKERYKLPGGGYLQKRDANGRYRNVRASGSWDVSFPLFDFGASIEVDDVALGYMTGQELSNHINTVVAQNVNTVRFEILRRLFKSTTDTFTDDIHGTLTVQPLANGDAVVYPPVIGSDTEATEDHYLESGYAAGAISNTNDPYVTIAADIEHHTGAPTGGANIATFINSAQTALTRDLAAFTALADMGVSYGDDTNLAASVPPQLLSMGSARVLGRHEEAGTWIVQWDYIPSAYMLGVHLDVSAPLKMRVDPADTGLGTGLQLVSEDKQFPFTRSTWRHRFGVGAGNRLNGVAFELGTGGTYTIPTQFA